MTAPKVPKVVAQLCPKHGPILGRCGYSPIEHATHPLLRLNDVVAWLEGAAKLEIDKGTHKDNFELAMIMALAAELREGLK